MQQNATSSLDFGNPKWVEQSLSERARGLVGSEILRIAQRIREMVAGGQAVCNLTVGDFNAKYFPIPKTMMQSIHQALDDGHTNYPPSDGVLALREAVTEYTAREWGVHYPVESVLVTSGARPVLYAVYRALIDPGETVLYPVPSWNNNHYCWMTGAKEIAVPTEPDDGFMPTLEALQPHLSEARLLALNSPLNPTGTVIGADRLRQVLEAVIDENKRRQRDGRRHLYVLHDQVYAALVFGGSKHHMPAQLVPEAAPWVIEVDGVSKAFAGTGLRVGWMLAAPELTRRAKSMIGHVGAWAPRPEQIATAAFLRDAAAVQEFRTLMDAAVQQRLDALYEGFEAMRRDGYPVRCIEPQGAIYLSLQMSFLGKRCRGKALDTNEAIRSLLLEQAQIGVVPFQAFGLDAESGWFRMSVGAVSMEEIDAMFPRLRALLDEVE